MSNIIDFTGIEDIMPVDGRLPAGVYKAEVFGVENGHSKAGDPMVTVDFRVIQGPYKGADVRHWFMIEKKNGKQSLLVLLKALMKRRFDTFDLANLPKLTAKELVIRTAVESREGKPQARVKEFYDVDSTEKAFSDFSMSQEAAGAAAAEEIPF